MWKYVGLLMLVALTACKDDPADPFDPGLMHLDGANNTAPFLPAGTVEAAARFDADILAQYAGKRIDNVQFFIYDIPDEAHLMIYGQGQGNEPGPVLYESEITGALAQGGWNTLPLLAPLDLPSDALWITIRMQINNGGIQVIGCDAGPAQDGGDWLFESTDNQWRTFRARSGSNINWNIRAVMIE
ncbi:MAG: hypothetical protein R3330_18965 [Saprospiraceae bacterium]|nr:hypothetical protein [Saprospiraceae bacterium]